MKMTLNLKKIIWSGLVVIGLLLVTGSCFFFLRTNQGPKDEVVEKDLPAEKSARNKIVIQPASSQMMSAWAEQLNSEGMNLYNKGDLQDAARLFKQSILADANYILPHYNLACVLNLLRNAGKAVDVKEIYDELTICLNLDAEKAKMPVDWIYSRLKEDADLDTLRGNEDYNKLLNYKIKNMNNKEKWFLGSWVNSGVVYFDFKADHTFTWSISFENSGSGSGRWKLNEATGELTIDCDKFVEDDFKDGGRNEVNPPSGGRFDAKKMELTIDWGEGQQIYKQDYTALIRAVEDGDCGAVLQLAKSGYDILRPIGEGMGPGSTMVYAIETKRAAMIRLLIGLGLSLKGDELTSLEKTDPEIFSLIINRNIKKKFPKGVTEVVEYILRNKIELDKTGEGNWNRCFFIGWSKELAGTSVLLEENFFAEAGELFYNLMILNGYPSETMEEKMLSYHNLDHFAVNGEQAPIPDTERLKKWMVANPEKWLSVLEKYDIVYPIQFQLTQEKIMLGKKEYEINLEKGAFSSLIVHNLANDRYKTYQEFEGDCELIGWSGDGGEYPGLTFVCFIKQAVKSELTKTKNGIDYYVDDLNIVPYINTVNRAELN